MSYVPIAMTANQIIIQYFTTVLYCLHSRGSSRLYNQIEHNGDEIIEIMNRN